MICLDILEAEHAASQGQLNAIKMVGAGGLDVNVQNLEKERMVRSTRGPGEPKQRNREVGA